MFVHPCANHAANMNVEGTRVVSCNTTGLSRTPVPLYDTVASYLLRQHD